MKDMAASVLTRLRNQARETGASHQECLQLFAQEELLRRLSRSKYAGCFVLKGGLFIYTVTEFATRSTKDIDFLLKGLNSEVENLRRVFEEIISTETENDFISFEVYGGEPITEESEYSGVRLNIRGHIKNVRIPFSIDIGVGDVIVPKARERELSVRLKGFEPVCILTYSMESTIAEKFEAILRRMEATSRMKDFYDLYTLSGIYDFDGSTLREAVWQTFQNRGTIYERDTMQRIAAFAENPMMQRLWQNYRRNSSFEVPDFQAALERIDIFLTPVFNAILRENEFTSEWSHESLSWICP